MFLFYDKHFLHILLLAEVMLQPFRHLLALVQLSGGQKLVQKLILASGSTFYFFMVITRSGVFLEVPR